MSAVSAESWEIDAVRSSLTFSLRHALLGEIRGQFRCWGGRITLDERSPTRPKVHVWVELSSLETGSPKRTQAILDTELFDVRWEPAVVFDGDRLQRQDDGRVSLTGEAELHSIRRPLSLSVDVMPSRDADAVTPTLLATAHASVDRRAFGLRRERTARDWLSERLVDRNIEIVAQVVATRAA
jgi:polyisoprenoid-binding protein YceI